MDAGRSKASSTQLILGSRLFEFPRHPPLVMGILNVTPDSFSDGGAFLNPEPAAARALEQIAEGAAMIDIGGESTRPGSSPVDPDVQICRVLPVIQRIRQRDRDIIISIDTTSSEVARAALQAGANIVNDTSALRDDSKMPQVVVEFEATVVLMHRRGTPLNMQADGGPQYENVLAEITSFLWDRMEYAVRSGIDPRRIMLDPGIGFGKRTQDNLDILNGLAVLQSLHRPLLVGASRKRFIGELLGLAQPANRDAGSVACAVIAAMNGASILRVHDVPNTVAAMKMWAAVSGRETA